MVRRRFAKPVSARISGFNSQPRRFSEMGEILILIAYKKGEVVYQNTRTIQLRQTFLKSNKMYCAPLKKDYWKLDEMIRNGGYEPFDGALVDPIEDKLILDESKINDYTIYSHKLSDLVKSLS